MNALSWIYTLRSYLDTYLGFLRGTPLFALVWLIALGVVIWFFGPAIKFGQWAPLEPVLHRQIALGVLFIGWVVYAIVKVVRRRRADRAMIEDIAEGDEIDPEVTAREEVSQLQERLKAALGRVRKIGGRRGLYDIPWYMIIGAPGSGKTTALLNAGLEFPFGDDVDGEARVSGVGGTRNCDWWFTEDAILIDTAGRYTTQDSDQTVDNTAWTSFLQLLKRYRPLKPVNGIIVTLPMDDLLAKSPAARIKDIRVVRQRLRDLEEQLKVRLPVYLVVTKTDVIAGFAEFFDGFNRFDREQVLGTTFPLGVSQSKGRVADAFESQYDLILERLNKLLLERLQQEPDELRRSRVYRFPAQLSALKGAMSEIVAELTASSKLVRPPLLRGVYFVSATQSGQVFDRTRTAISERFAFIPDAVRSGPAGDRSFFLTRLFKEVIFNEANLVVADGRVKRRRALASTVLYSLPLIAGSLLFAGWAHAWFSNQSTLGAVNARIAAYNRDAADVPIENVDSGDIVRVAGPLNDLRAAIVEDVPGTDRWFHVGVEQEPKLVTSLNASYRRALNGLLLPRLLVYLEDGIDQNGIDAGTLYRRLKLYTMLGGLGRMDPDFVRASLSADFDERLPGAGRAGLREDLIAHVDALIENGVPAITLDEALIDAARDALREASPAERIYEVIAGSPEALELPEWRVSDKAGAGADVLFERRGTGQSLREGVSGLYTRTGLYDVVLPQLEETADAFLDERWVLGEDYTSGLTADDLKRDVLRRYFAEQREAWSSLLADLGPRDVTDFAQATTMVGVLTSGNNPMLSLAQAVATDTDMRPAQAGAEAATGTDPADLLQRAAATVGGAATLESAYLLDDFGSVVLDPYSDLRRYVAATEDQPSEFTNSLDEVFEELFRQLSRTAVNQSDVNRRMIEGALGLAVQSLITEAQRIPAPLDRWLGVLASDIARLSAGEVRQTLSDLWRTSGGRFCRAAIAGRYPFVRGAPNDVAINDFVRMFGPSGEFASFFELHLKPFVDTTVSPWRWTGQGTDAPASDALAQFENAEAIRSAFFADGSGLSLSLDITPVELDNDSSAVLLSLNDQSLTYDHGPVKTKSLEWPGTGNRSARIAFQPPAPGVSATRSGPWATFRLFDLAERDAAGDDKFRATFDLGNRSASFDVQTGSVLNPFSLPQIEAFECPESL